LRPLRLRGEHTSSALGMSRFMPVAVADSEHSVDIYWIVPGYNEDDGREDRKVRHLTRGYTKDYRGGFQAHPRKAR